MRSPSPMIWILGVVFLVMGQASANSATSKNQQSTPPGEQIALSGQMVEKVIQVLPKLISLTKSRIDTQSANPDNKAEKKQQNADFTTALQALSSQHGFKDMATMQRTVKATMLTASFLKSGRTLKQVEEKLQKTRELVERNDKMTAKQKSSLLQRMQLQISRVIPSSENIAIVKPFYPRILAITGKQ